MVVMMHTGDPAVAAATKTERVVGWFRKNSREEVRVTIEEFHGRLVCNMRVFWRHPDTGEMLPSRKGLTISTDRLPELVEVLNRALLMASPTAKPAA